jgi:hypothetical protein
MSQTQVEATALLCRLLERDKPEINGQALVTDHADAATHLLRERLLVLGRTLDWVTCPECSVETARVMRELSPDRIALRCPACADVEAPRRLQETHKVALQRVIAALLNGLGLSANGLKPIDHELTWRLGTTEPARGKALTWYFARRLTCADVAVRLREQIALERTTTSCVVLTSSELPLPPASPMLGFDVRSLPSVARIGQSRFEFFAERQALPGPQSIAEVDPVTTGMTTLQYVRAHGKVVVDGVKHALEPRQQSILLALIDDLDHEVDKDALKTACGSQAQRFSPSKEFDRNPLVYKTFIRYLRDDERYALIIPNGDRTWLR